MVVVGWHVRLGTMEVLLCATYCWENLHLDLNKGSPNASTHHEAIKNSDLCSLYLVDKEIRQSPQIKTNRMEEYISAQGLAEHVIICGILIWPWMLEIHRPTDKYNHLL